MHAGRHSCEGLAEGNPEELNEEDNEQVEPSTVQTCGSLSEPDRIHHQNPVSHCADNREWDFRNELRESEDLRSIDPTMGLTNESPCRKISTKVTDTDNGKTYSGSTATMAAAET